MSRGGTSLFVTARDKTYIDRTSSFDLSKCGTNNRAAFAKYGLNKRKETQLLATVIETSARFTDWENDTDLGDFKLNQRGLGPPLRQSVSFSAGDRMMSEKMALRVGENQLISPMKFSVESIELKTAMMGNYPDRLQVDLGSGSEVTEFTEETKRPKDWGL
ncbi:hypothetical protein B0J14DRAFT_672479 [Halenospora varia]|nr:hypothetical protein B0J14DRAFT_672479 [Halenospora varia]